MSRQNMLESFIEPLESLQRLLSRLGERGVIIGGTAVSIIGKARYTEDLDAMFLLSFQDIPHFLEEAKREGIEPRIDNAVEFAKKSRVLLMRHALTNTNIDISMGIMPFEEEMVRRSVVHKIDESLRLRLPTPEDLIIMKAVAHRPKDLEDIRTIADKYPKLDVKRIQRWVAEFGEILGMPELWESVKPLVTK